MNVQNFKVIGFYIFNIFFAKLFKEYKNKTERKIYVMIAKVP